MAKNKQPLDPNVIQQTLFADKTHLIKKKKYHGQAKSHPNQLFFNLLRGFRINKETPLPKKRQLHSPAFDKIPASILDEIKMQGAQTQDQLRKARLRQALFLNKRRKGKHNKRLAGQLKAFGRLFLSLALLVGWVLLFQAPVWTIPLDNISVFTGVELTGEPKLFSHLPAIKQTLYQQVYQKPIYQLDPTAIENKLRLQYKTLAHVTVRRSLLPASLDVAVVEKPVWAGLILLHQSDHQPLKQLYSRWESSISLPLSKSDQPVFDANTFQQVALLHPESKLSVFPFQSVGNQQKQFLQQKIPVFAQKRMLNTNELASLQKVIVVWQQQEASFLRFKTPLKLIDARDPDSVFAVFDSFKVHLGKLDTGVVNRAARLPSLMTIISQYVNNLDWVELAWNQQVTLKLQDGASVAQTGMTPLP